MLTVILSKNMVKKMKNDNFEEYIIKYFEILEANFGKKIKDTDRIPLKKVFEMVEDLNSMISQLFEKKPVEAGKLSKLRYIPLLNYLIKVDKTQKEKYNEIIYNAYRMASRVSLEHYFIYREWNEPVKEKFFTPRYQILRGYIHYLEEIATNPNFRMLVACLPSGYGKTYPEKISEAWNFGLDPTGTVLSLCSNERVVNGGSNTVRNELKSEEFGSVFANLKYDRDDKEYFKKETDAEWRLRDCKLLASYYASTINSNVVGQRASQRIHIDDLYPSYIEAMNQKTNEEYYYKFQTVWNKRFIQNVPSKVVVTGTLWASGDFISLVIADINKNNKMHPSPKYKYTWVNEDETIAVVRVPALDYDTGMSTCPELRTTKEIEEERKKMPEYLFETNFQQNPVDPEGLVFSYSKLKTYEKIPMSVYEGHYAVIDANRKTGRDYFSMPIFRRVDEDNLAMYYLKDCIYTQRATKDLYDDIVQKILEHHIIKLVIESNATSELKANLDRKLKEMGATFCEIKEKWNNENKEARITDQSHSVVQRFVYPAKEIVSAQSQMGRFMNDLTTYNLGGRNRHDDCPDSLCLASKVFIEGALKQGGVVPIYRPF